MREPVNPVKPWLIAVVTFVTSTAPAHGQLTFSSVGAEADDESGYIAFGAVGGNLAASTSWDLAVSHADTSTDFYDLQTTSYDGSVYHDFGSIGLRVGLGGWSDDEIVAVGRLSAALDLHGDDWSVGLLARRSNSDFETLEIDRTITRRDGSLVTIEAKADCEIDDTGIGARLRITRGQWSYAVDAMSFDYDAITCGFDLPTLDVLRRSSREEFAQFANRVTDVLSLGAGRRLLAETSFLDSRFGFSVVRDLATRSYGMYFDRLKDAFFSRTSATLSGSIGLTLRSGNEIELYLGATDSDGRDTILFVGMSFLVLR